MPESDAPDLFVRRDLFSNWEVTTKRRSGSGFFRDALQKKVA